METYQLNYRLKLAGQAVFSSTDGDPNLVESEGYIPGSAIWGALAARYIRKKRLDSAQAYHHEEFRHWFLEDKLRCLNAYLYVASKDLSAPVRLLPPPVSIKAEKGSLDTLYDLSATSFVDENGEEPQTTALGEGFVVFQAKRLYIRKPVTRYNYHTWRKNRLKGRAVDGNGTIFVYEALEAGQTFEGRLLGSQEDLTALLDCLEWSKESSLSLRLGRSRSTQYGGSATLELTEEKPIRFEREVKTSSLDFSETPLVITMLSPGLFQDELGYPTLEFPVSELQEIINQVVSECKVTLENPQNRFVKKITVGGYSSVWRLPRPQWPAVQAGSVFIFNIRGVTPEALQDALLEIEAASLGLRTGEGFGRFALNWHGKNENLTKYAFPLEKIKPPQTPVPVQFVELVTRLVQENWLRQARKKGLEVAQGFINEGKLGSISPALLSRLEAMACKLEKQTDGLLFLTNLRKPARQQLEQLRNTSRYSLYDVLEEVLKTKDVLKDPLKLSNKAIEEVTKKIGWELQIEQVAKLQLEVIKAYIFALVNYLSRERRKPKEEN